MATLEVKALPEVKKLFDLYGLQVLLKTLIQCIDDRINDRINEDPYDKSKALPSKMVLEMLKGVYKAYLCRNWGDDEDFS